MYIKYSTKGIIISGRNDGDDSRKILVFTESFGLIGAKVQGGRNLKSKLRAGTQDFCFGDFSLVRGKNGFKIVSARSQKNFFEIFKNDQLKLRAVGNILGLIKKLVAEEESQADLFNIVLNFLNFLDTKPTRGILVGFQNTPFDSVALAEALTLMRILHNLGYMVNDPEFSLPISSAEIDRSFLQTIAPRRSKIISLINQSLKSI